MNTEKFSIVIFIAIVMIMVFGVIGWFMNLVKLVRLDFKEPYKAEIIRGIGLVPVVGAVTGYIDIQD